MITYVQDPIRLNECIEWLNRQTTIGLDTETNGLDPLINKVLLIQVGTDETQFVINTYKLDLREFFVALNREDLVKVLHNAVFDYGMLYTNYEFRLDNFVCTMIANKLLTQGRQLERNSYAAICEKYIGVKIDKEEQTSFVDMEPGDYIDKDQVMYSSIDVKYLPRLYDIIQGLLNSRGMELVAKIEYETIKVTAEMQVHGVYIDTSLWLDLKNDAEQNAERTKGELEILFEPHCSKNIFGDLLFDPIVVTSESKPMKKNIKGKPGVKSKPKVKAETLLNINSNIQVKYLLEKCTGLKLDSTDGKYLLEFDEPVIEKLLEYRKYAKLVSTYGEEFIKEHVNPITKRIHPTFKQLGTESGRYSCDKPNLQNIPKSQKYRTPFCVKDPNYRIVSADFSAQELALIAFITKEPKFLEALTGGLDIHCVSGSLLYDIPYEDFFDHDETGKRLGRNKEMDKKYRNPAKSITFGLAYGMGPKKLAKSLGITIAEAKKLLDKYFTVFPNIKSKLNEFTTLVKNNKYAWSPLDGRRRDFSNIDWDDNRKVSHAVNAAKNLPFQGGGATITKLAMCNVRREFLNKGYDAELILTVHDELLAEVHESVAEECKNIIEQEMIGAFNYFAPGIPMKVDAQIGTYWIH